MLLSIVVIICDKDWFLLKELCRKIEEAVPFSYELVVMDNREANKEPLDIANEKVISCNGNVYQFEARRRAMYAVSGKYVWFIDGDDCITPLDERAKKALQEAYDIITFNWNGLYMVSDEESSGSLKKKDVTKMGVQLWNKWISGALIKKIRDEIPPGLEVVASEDKYLFLLMLTQTRHILYISNSYYVYRDTYSFASAKKIRTKEHFEHLFKGLETIRPYIQKLKSNCYFDETDDCSFYLDKFQSCDKSIKKECAEIFSKHFPDKMLVMKSFSLLCFQKNMENKERKEFIRFFPFLAGSYLFDMDIAENYEYQEIISPCNRLSEKNLPV